MLTNAYKALERVKYFCTHDADVREAEAGLDELDSIREQVRALTAERDAMTTCPKCSSASGDDWSQCGGSCPIPMSPHYAPHRRAQIADAERQLEDERSEVALKHAALIGALEECNALRARVAEVDAAHLLLDRAGQSPVQPHLGLRIQALLEKCDEGWRRAKALESERDAAQQRAKAVEGAVRRVTREALEALEKMPTPTKEYEALATLQRNLLQRLREETDAAMAAATTNTEAP